MQLERRALLATAGSTLAIGVAGCLGNEGNPAGDGDDSTTTDGSDGMDATETTTETTESTDATETTGGTSDATVQVTSHDELGDVLVGPDGMTLYMFDQDTQGESASMCYDSCASNWPPLTVAGEPAAADAVTAELSTFERDDGATQVAANGWPLYYFAGDQSAGDANGQGVGGVWWVLQPDGMPVRPADDGTTTTGDGGGTTTTGEGTTTGGGGGYGYDVQ